MERMNIWVYGYWEIVNHFPQSKAKALEEVSKVIDISTITKETEFDRDIAIDKLCERHKPKEIRFFKDGSLFNEKAIMQRCDYDGYTYEDHVRDTVQDALDTYSEGYKPRREELYAKARSIDGFLDACKLAEAIIKLGDICKQDTRKKEKINSADDLKAGNFYYHTVLFRTYLVTNVTDEGVNYMSSGYGEKPISTEIENFIEYFVSLPDTKSFDY